MRKLMKSIACIAPLAMIVLCPLLLVGQNSASDTSITGCLKQGNEPGGYYIVAEDGKTYELVGFSSDVSQHLNQTVSVSGHPTKLPEAQESKLEQHEKVEVHSGNAVDFQVKDLKMVSSSCQ